jgi:hypothetical protein
MFFSHRRDQPLSAPNHSALPMESSGLLPYDAAIELTQTSVVALALRSISD